MVGAGSTRELSPESQEEQTVLGRNRARAGGTLDWAQGRARGGPWEDPVSCSGTFSYGRTEGQGWKDGVGGGQIANGRLRMRSGRPLAGPGFSVWGRG